MMLNPKSAFRSGSSRGFSLLELMIVVAIAVILAAMAIPNIRSAYYNTQFRGAINEASSIVQQCRLNAVRNNSNMAIMSGTRSGAPILFVDVAQSGTYARDRKSTRLNSSHV